MSLSESTVTAVTQAARSSGMAAATASGPSASVWMSPSSPEKGTARWGTPAATDPPANRASSGPLTGVQAITYPWASIRAVRPPVAGTEPAGTRGSTAMCTVPGQSLQTRADLTQGSEATDRSASSTSRYSIGSPAERLDCIEDLSGPARARAG